MPTPRLALPEIAASQAQKHVTVNEALGLLDVFVQLTVKGVGVNAPPAGVDGDAYLTGTAPTGAWSGYPSKIAFMRDGAWRFATPIEGMTFVHKTTGVLYLYPSHAIGAKPLLSVNAAGQLIFGDAPPSSGKLQAVAAAGGVSLALSDNASSSLYVRHAPGGATIGTDPTGILNLAAGGNAVADRKVVIDPQAGDGETPLSLFIGTAGAAPTQRRIVVGAPDSAGAGYRTLRVTN